MAHDSNPTRSPLLVLGKISEILDAFTFDRPSLTLSGIHIATGIPTSTVQRLVTNMVSQGFLDRNGDQIRIGTRMAYWAATATRDLNVLAVVNPILKEIRDVTGETACFFRVEQNYRVCVAVAETHYALRREMHVGKIIPLTVGSAGRVLLAHSPELAANILSRKLEPMTEVSITDADTLRAVLTETLSDGYAITTGEREVGASGLSAPVFDSAADIIGALTISGPTFRMPQAQCESWVDLIVSQAQKTTRTLGGRYPA
ncbi:IclR family transcriptional regulator [Rhodococcus erythropolis]|uniref:IclR family transcriptional regulator n=1 Tax=Rhodococcus erythropolis TaxID=1833 RepID=UPI0022263817|nr:IclR family transcriptional regulator [Rhodococcus erythropolis]MCW2295382.1 DNA-binding IclR family transcriptional regulator [Rhodococcus erythropolis]